MWIAPQWITLYIPLGDKQFFDNLVEDLNPFKVVERSTKEQQGVVGHRCGSS